MPIAAWLVHADAGTPALAVDVDSRSDALEGAASLLLRGT